MVVNVSLSGNIFWNCANGNWSNPGCWWDGSTTRLPVSSDNVYLDGNRICRINSWYNAVAGSVKGPAWGTYDLSLVIEQNGSLDIAANLEMAHNSSSSIGEIQTYGDVNIGGYLSVAYFGEGLLHIYDGSVTVAGNIEAAYDHAGKALIILEGGSLSAYTIGELRGSGLNGDGVIIDIYEGRLILEKTDMDFWVPAWIDDGKIVGYGGRGTVLYDRDTTTPGRLTVWAEPFDKAGNPDPEDGSQDNPLPVTLSWNPAFGSASFDVYIGTDREAVERADRNSPVFMDNTTQNEYQPSLANDQTYYWRIDGLDASQQVIQTGDVWSFSTVFHCLGQLTIINGDFELPALELTGKYLGTELNYGLAGTGWNGQNIWGHLHDDGIAWGTPVNGSNNQVAYLSSEGSGQGRLWRDTAHTIQSGCTYVLSAGIACASNDIPDPNNGIIMKLQACDGGGTYDVETETIIRRGLRDNALSYIECMFVADNSVPQFLGKDIRVCFETLYPAGNQGTFKIDDVTLTKQPNYDMFLDNGYIKVGLNIHKGGAITWLSASGSSTNLVNDPYDPIPGFPDPPSEYGWGGRQIQPTLSSGNGVDYWFPNQVADTQGNMCPVLEYINTGKMLYTKTHPNHWWGDAPTPYSSAWPLTRYPIPTQCYLETWVTFEEPFSDTIKATYRWTVFRDDDRWDPSGSQVQEYPSVNLNADMNKLYIYNGNEPWTFAEMLTDIGGFGKDGKIEEVFNQVTEKWGAWVYPDTEWGVGAYTPKSDPANLVIHVDNGPLPVNRASILTPLKFDMSGVPKQTVVEFDTYFVVNEIHSIRNRIYSLHFGLGDVNFDGSIDNLDLSKLGYYWLDNDLDVDINGDGIVDFLDFSYFSENFNP